MKVFRCFAAALAVVQLAASAAIAADRLQQVFVKEWEGRRVVVTRTLFTLIYNERGLLGNTASGRKDGLTVVTPFEGTYFQFDGRQGRDDVVQRDLRGMVDAVANAYSPDSLDVRKYRKLEPVMIARYDAGVELVVSSVRLSRDAVKMTLVPPGEAPSDDAAVTSLTVRWPMPLSKSFSEREPIEALIRGFLADNVATAR